MTKVLENHQCRKCKKCPFYWYDGWYSESGCYIDEVRYGELSAKLLERLSIDGYSGCFIPLFVLKLLFFIFQLKDKKYYKQK